MATIPIIGKVTVDGTAKNISGGYVNIGGVWNPNVKTYVNSGGVWIPAWKELYTWKKYLVTNVEGAPYTEVKGTSTLTQNFGRHDTITIYYASAYTFDKSTGKFALKFPTTGTINNMASGKYYSTQAKSGLSSVRYCTQTEYVSASGYIRVRYNLYSAKGTVTQEMGDYIEDVTSETESTYPDNGVHTDGHWYVKQEG